MPGPVTRFFASTGFARGLGAVGRLMITSGTIILLLVAYQVWGTNLQTGKSQRQIKSQFASQLDDSGTVGTTAPPTTDRPTTTTTTAPAASSIPVTSAPAVAPTITPPAAGEPVGRISIPSIGLRNFYFVEGTGVAQLKRGAAHYPLTPLPGQQGNAAIAGHRTTYGAPFHNVDKMKNGDEVIVETLQGKFTYKVFETRIVRPSDTSVLDDTLDNRLTLTACHPKFSARERIIIIAKLVGNTTVPTLPGQAEAAQEVARSTGTSDTNAIDQFDTEPVLRFPGAFWGLACMALWILIRLLAWLGHRTERYGRWIPYVIGTPICLVFLYFFFEAFNYEALTRTLNLSI